LAGQFVIESFKSRKHDYRSDKGKKHSYPKIRVRWNYFRQGQDKPNLTRYVGTADNVVMDQKKEFKNPPEVREYWRTKKQNQRAIHKQQRLKKTK
jgi:hypothetical protein